MTLPLPPDLAALATALASGVAVDRATIRDSVKRALNDLAASAPGHSVEVRVPPHAAVQCIPGVRHRRGTPPAVVETDAATWLALAIGHLTWAEALNSGRVRASGERSDLSPYLPIYELA